MIVESDAPTVLYEYAADWGEYMEWETTPVSTDEQAGPNVAKIYC